MTPDPDAGEPERDTGGFLSTHAEWHAFVMGIYLGFTSKALVTPPVPENRDILKEPHYYQGGYILGTFLQLVALALTLYFGLEFMGPGVVWVGGLIPPGAVS